MYKDFNFMFWFILLLTTTLIINIKFNGTLIDVSINMHMDGYDQLCDLTILLLFLNFIFVLFFTYLILVAQYCMQLIYALSNAWLNLLAMTSCLICESFCDTVYSCKNSVKMFRPVQCS